jgi:hypothetical protein
MKDKAGNSLFIDYSSVKEVFNRTLYHLPKVYFPHILSDMENLKMIKKQGGGGNYIYTFLLHKKDMNLPFYKGRWKTYGSEGVI